MIISVSGVRGVVGEDLDAGVARHWGAAFGHISKNGPVVVGRDARPSGAELSKALIEGILSQGVDVVDAGLCSTPTIEMGILHLHASGGVMVTASHNPPKYNGIKFFGADGIVVAPNIGKKLASLAKDDPEPASQKGAVTPNEELPAVHTQRVVESIDAEAVRARHFKVVVDGCSSVGGPVMALLLRELNCNVTEIDCEPTGNFTRQLEPRADVLGTLSTTIRENDADIGFAVDPDGDRLCAATGDGTVLSEEYTVPLVAMNILNGTQGEKIVVNLCTSRMIEDVAARFGATVFRSKVGEHNVVEVMKREKAIVGGEGNGGAMVPAVNPSRDAVVGAAHILDLLASQKKPLADIVDEIPAYVMIKEKHTADFSAALLGLEKNFAGTEIDKTDGLRATWPDKWVQVRPSGTEPVVRIIAEAVDKKTAMNLVKTVRGLLIK